MPDNEKKILFGFGLLGVGGLLLFMRKSLSGLASAALDEANDALFRASLPSRAEPYADVIRQVSREQGIDPFLLVALVQREDPSWNPAIVSPDGGYGLTQITSDTAWIASANWEDPYTNLSKGAQMFNDYLSQAHAKGLEGDVAVQAALGAYNHGPRAISNVVLGGSADTGTTGGNYASDVFATYATLSNGFATILG